MLACQQNVSIWILWLKPAPLPCRWLSFSLCVSASVGMSLCAGMCRFAVTFHVCKYMKIQVSLRDCLRHYYEPEQLSGSDRYKCEGCNKLQESTKKLSLLKPPEVMTLHIKRFRYDTAFGSSIGSKINEHVEFPLNDLDMRPFTKDSTEYSQVHPVTKPFRDVLIA